jgi:hypothetical protein
MRYHEIKEDAPVPKPRVELGRVILAKPVKSEDGIIPAGAAGTILHVYPNGVGYDVEFSVPQPYTVASVKADDLVP